jgi:hypothetical protein
LVMERRDKVGGRRVERKDEAKEKGGRLYI